MDAVQTARFDRKFICVQFPGLVNDEKNAVESLGGAKELAQVMKSFFFVRLYRIFFHSQRVRRFPGPLQQEPFAVAFSQRRSVFQAGVQHDVFVLRCPFKSQSKEKQKKLRRTSSFEYSSYGNSRYYVHV